MKDTPTRISCFDKDIVHRILGIPMEEIDKMPAKALADLADKVTPHCGICFGEEEE